MKSLEPFAYFSPDDFQCFEIRCSLELLAWLINDSSTSSQTLFANAWTTNPSSASVNSSEAGMHSSSVKHECYFDNWIPFLDFVAVFAAIVELVHENWSKEFVKSCCLKSIEEEIQLCFDCFIRLQDERGNPLYFRFSSCAILPYETSFLLL